ncbi:GTPase domain-containing protein [Mycolicibacterium sp. P1-5]|uniref:GTPase domain-containing protein n=1 Tax=Mycolicibacterium sp. P1-5 TaxID=2024617 RepID=UPI0018839C1C|nr:GTPase domain-containing protein [Mycolicibacterium sp. P1-5]
MSPIDITEAKAWLDAIPGGQLGIEADQQWHLFASISEPVVTVYGAYDTGKSSLLRRLIVDSGVEVPEWLTISARHETFEVNEVRVAGCLLRDTPGFVTGADDARADMNTQLANAAVDLTDVVIVTVTPQLATAEFPALQALVRRAWDPGSLWFVISRFDEAGVDPESDLDGYRERSKRKTDELRSALDLDDAVPVFVVSQDFAQMAGSERNPDPQMWDDCRGWDGMAELRSALIDLGSGNGSSLRASAAQRFWRRAVGNSLDGLNVEVAKYLDHENFSEEGLRLRQSWLAQLEALQKSADADLRGKISECIGQAVDDQRDADAIQLSLKTSIDFWYGLQERSVEKLLRNVDDTIALEKQRPPWKKLETLAESIRVEADRSTSAKETTEVISPTVERVSNAALKALTEYEKYSSLKKPTQAAASSAMNMSKRVAVATATLPLVVEMSSIAEKFLKSRADAAERDRQRKFMEAELERTGERAATLALSEFEPLADAARQAILDATAERVDLRDGLGQLVAELRRLIDSGESLLRTSGKDLARPD